MQRKISTKGILIKYAVMGPPIGGVFLSIFAMLWTVSQEKYTFFALFTNIFLSPILFALFSYPFGLLPSIMCGKYLARSLVKDRVFRAWIYYSIAIFGAFFNWMLLYLITGATAFTPYYAIFIGVAALFSSFVLLRHTRRDLPTISSAQKPEIITSDW